MKKLIKHLAVASLIVASINAEASYTLTGGAPNPITASAGSSGSSIFTVTLAPIGGGNWTTVVDGWGGLSLFGNTYASPVNLDRNDYSVYTVGDTGRPNSGVNIFSALSVASVSSLSLVGNGNSIAPGSYTVTVDWTISNSATVGNVNSIFFDFAAKTPDNSRYEVIPSASITVAAVPEPGQALAGAVLLGCGALVFTGRRWIKAQAAK